MTISTMENGRIPIRNRMDPTPTGTVVNALPGMIVLPYFLIACRYYDKERSKSPATRQPSSSLSTHSASGAGSSSSAALTEKKINLNIKSPAAAAAAVKAAAAAKPAKKIDMGAAKNFGQSADLGINSPTHRNTHAEEIISTSDATTSGKLQQQQSNEILDDLFRTCPPAPPSIGSPARDDFDDFNPRADDFGMSGGVKGGQEFGDFESAFGKPTPKAASNEFADFAAFSSAPVPTPVAAPSSDLFFGLNPSATSAAPASAEMNLFGMAQQQQQPAAQGNDLLSDLSGLSLGGSTNGEWTVSFTFDFELFDLH